MAANETEREMCARHVHEGKIHVAHQRRIVARLRAARLSTHLAEQLLVQFEQTLIDHRAHLARVIAAEA